VTVDVDKLVTCDYCVQVRGVVQYYVHYVDYNKRLDEWVTEDRLDTRKIEPPQVTHKLSTFNGKRLDIKQEPNVNMILLLFLIF
jgi:hypothetical protein